MEGNRPSENFSKFPVIFPVLSFPPGFCRIYRTRNFMPQPGPTRAVAAQTGHSRVDAACRKAARRRRPEGMIMPLFAGARADLWKRTNFEIPNEINAVRVPCRGGPGGEEAHRSDGLGAGTASKRSYGRGVSFLLGNLVPPCCFAWQQAAEICRCDQDANSLTWSRRRLV
jgi:hypothetical protein